LLIGLGPAPFLHSGCFALLTLGVKMGRDAPSYRQSGSDRLAAGPF
jgi:hypothetical protein